MPLLVVLAGLAVFLIDEESRFRRERPRRRRIGRAARRARRRRAAGPAAGRFAEARRRRAASGSRCFKGLQAAAVAAVAIRQPKAAITIEKKDERWVIAERDGFPADYDKVRDFVLKAIALKVGQSEPIGEKDRARLLLDAGGTAIELRGADGKPLARLTAGKKYFKAEPENPDRAIGDGRYVALPGDEKRVIVVSDPLTQASAKTADWISKAGFEAEKIKIAGSCAPRDGSRVFLAYRALRRQRRLEAGRRARRRETRSQQGECGGLHLRPDRARRRRRRRA